MRLKIKIISFCCLFLKVQKLIYRPLKEILESREHKQEEKLSVIQPLRDNHYKKCGFIHILSISGVCMYSDFLSLLNQTGIKIFYMFMTCFSHRTIIRNIFCIFKYSLQSAFLNDGIVFPSVAVPHLPQF